ncbi:DNA polymerase I [Johnsonella ignava]|uniref:DNA polymerase I n=1 Tax=Johnsonella ignava TaxID=43995 RepID=UPI0023F0ABB1|nr:DNA polymerase I [Johnsonella ignava]
MEKLILIDGHSILNRAFYAIPVLTDSEGRHTNAVYGFLNIMFKVIDEEKADYLAVAFDLPAPTFRHKVYKEYKSTRKAMPDELKQQVPLIKDVLNSMNIAVYSMEGFEADDIIGSLAKKYASKDTQVVVLSGDRDLLQISDKNIKIKIPKTLKGKTETRDYFPEDVLNEYKVSPLEYIDVKALMGDASDNIPGVKSIGEKTATSIIEMFKSIENAYKHVDEIKPPRASKALAQNYETAVFSKKLVTIKLDVPVESSLKDMGICGMYNENSLKIMQSLEFKSLIKRFSSEIIEEAGRDFKTDYNVILNAKEAFELVDLIDKSKPYGMEFACDNNSITAFCLSGNDGKCSIFIAGDTVKRAVDELKDDNLSVENDEKITENDLIELIKKCFNEIKLVYLIDLKNIIKKINKSKSEYIKEKDNIIDVAVAAYLNNPIKDSYKPEDLAGDYLNMGFISKEDLLDVKNTKHEKSSKKGIKKLSFCDEIKKDNQTVLNYFASVSHIICLAGDVILKRVKELGMEALYFNIELPLIYSLARMEIAGIGVDRKRLDEYGVKLKGLIDDIEKEIHDESGSDFNINSPKQLGEVLFYKLNMPGGKKTKTGYSTAADVLEKLAPDYPLVKKILYYRQLAKLYSTYALGLAAYIGSDGRIHGNFNQTITATGRISSTEPNLQNIPVRTDMGSRIRDIFVPGEGYVFVDADYSQIELRVLASMADDKSLIESYKNEVDIHTATASKVFATPAKEVTKEQRRNAKAVNFGVIYGISAFGLSEDLSISRREALEYINNYFKTYPEVKKFLDLQVKKAKEDGFVTTLYGRIRPIPEIKSSNFMQRAFGDRVAMNSPIQGTAADIMKKAMIDVDRMIKKSGYDARIVLQVHDELLLEVNKENAEAVRRMVEETMKSAAQLKVALEVEAKIGNTWLEAK